jgi:hypothetical protein
MVEDDKEMAKMMQRANIKEIASSHNDMNTTDSSEDIRDQI